MKTKIVKSLKNYFIFIFLIFKSFNHAYSYHDTNAGSHSDKFMYNYMYPIVKNIVNKNDPTTYEDVKFIKKETRATWDKRYGDSLYEASFYVFDAKFQLGNNVKVFINSEFQTHEKIAEIALKYSKMLGQLPVFLKKEVRWIIIHGPWKDKSKCTCMWYADPRYPDNRGFYIHTEMVKEKEEQEVAIHEAAHLAVDTLYYGTKNHSIWTDAQLKDSIFITKYAKKNPNREDIAESIVAWIAVRCKKDRIIKSAYKKIIKNIPNRIKIFDNYIFNNMSTYPLVCKK